MDLPNSGPVEFMFATGIENSYPTIACRTAGQRVDEMEQVRPLPRAGARTSRWSRSWASSTCATGRPTTRRYLGPGRYDWTFADDDLCRAAGARASCRSSTCATSACRTGWATSRTPTCPASSPSTPAPSPQRFPWVQLYTPVNEIFIARHVLGRVRLVERAAEQRPRRSCTALKHLCQANLLAMQAILEVRPDAMFVQSESTEYFHADGPGCHRARRASSTRSASCRST